MVQIHLLVGSTLGAAEYLADHLAERLNEAGHPTRIHNPASLAGLGDTAGHLLLAVTATHGAGEIPDNLKPFARELAQQQPNLGHSHYAVVALGDSNYDTFCAAGHQMQALLEGCGAQPVGAPCLIDVTAQDLPEDAADIWLETWLPLLAQA